MNDLIQFGGLSNRGTMAIVSSTITRTGGVYNDVQAKLTIEETLITGNSASTGTGGGILNVGNATLNGCTIEGNSTSLGGGLGNLQGGTLTLTDCTIDNNYAANAGGGIYNTGNLVLVNSTVSGNTLTANAADLPGVGGGGIENVGTAVLVNSTISGNSVQGGTTSSHDMIGGGIDNSGTLTLTNCTVANNLAAAGMNTTNDATGGGIYASAGKVTLNNTIVAENHSALPGPGALLPDDVDAAIDPSSAYNLIGNGDGATGLSTASHNEIGTAASPIDPKLGPLADNGGPTQTMALLAGSPATDAGSNVLAVGPDGKPFLTDQRGYYRIFNGTVDIGAYEFGSSPLLPGDADADGKVDFADLVLVARHWGMTNAAWSDGDFNRDGSVGFDDLLIVARNYGKSVSLTTSAVGVFSASVVGAASSGSAPAATSDVSESHRHQRRPRH